MENEIKEYEVYNSSKDAYFKVDDDWLTGVKRTGIKELELYYTATDEVLKATYEDGTELHYKNIFGSWGDPVEIN